MLTVRLQVPIGFHCKLPDFWSREQNLHILTNAKAVIQDASVLLQVSGTGLASSQ